MADGVDDANGDAVGLSADEVVADVETACVGDDGIEGDAECAWDIDVDGVTVKDIDVDDDGNKNGDGDGGKVADEETAAE